MLKSGSVIRITLNKPSKPNSSAEATDVDDDDDDWFNEGVPKVDCKLGIPPIDDGYGVPVKVDAEYGVVEIDPVNEYVNIEGKDEGVCCIVCTLPPDFVVEKFYKFFVFLKVIRFRNPIR